MTDKKDGGLAYLPQQLTCNCYFATPCLTNMWPQDPHVSETWSDKIAIAHKLNDKPSIIPIKKNKIQQRYLAWSYQHWPRVGSSPTKLPWWQIMDTNNY